MIDPNNNNTQSPEDQLEEYALQLVVKDFAYRSKAKAKPQRKGYSPRIIPMNARNWIDIEPGKYSLSEYEVSKKVIHLLRDSIGLTMDGKHAWQQVEQYCTDGSGIIVYFRVLQGHSGSNLPSLQDNVLIRSNFFQYIYHIVCAFNLHSIINSGLIPGGQNSSKRQTVCLPVDTRDKSHKDPDKIDLSVPRRAQYLHNAWKKHEDAVYWVDINLGIRKGLTFNQTRSNAIILQETLPAYCTPKVVRLEDWRSLI